MQLGDLLQRQPAVQADVEGLVRLDEIDQLMGHSIPLRWRRLVRADVHAAVHLRGVGRENFRAEHLRDMDRHPTLPDGRRPDEKHHWQSIRTRLGRDLALSHPPTLDAPGRVLIPREAAGAFIHYSVHPKRPKMRSSSSIVKRMAMRRPCGHVLGNPATRQSSSSFRISGTSSTRPARTALWQATDARTLL